MILTGETEVIGEKPAPSATQSTTDLTWINRDWNPDIRGERPASRLSNGTILKD